MNKDKIIAAAEAEVEKAESVVKRWLKSAWAWLKSLSFKTKATIVVGVAIASGLMFTLISASHAPSYVTRSEANAVVSGLRMSIGSMASKTRVAELSAQVAALESRIKVLEEKPKARTRKHK